jgi:hypothetical protein
MCMAWSDVAEFLKSASIVVASGVAIWGISAWRREHLGKKRLDTAEEMLSLFYQARDAIIEIRSPGSVASEASGRARAPYESEEDASIRDRAYIPIARYQRQSELFGKLKSLRYRAMAQFGPHFGKPFDDLDRVIREILTATSTLANLWRSLGAPENAERNRAFMLALEARIWAVTDMDGNPDAMASRVDAIVSEVEKLARPQIDRVFGGWSWKGFWRKSRSA